MKYSWRHVTHYLPWLPICLLLVWSLAPIVSLFLVSITTEEAPVPAGLRLPEKMTLQNYTFVFFQQGIRDSMLSSLIIALVTVLLVCILAVGAAYGFSRHPGRWVNMLFLALLFVRTIPFITFAVPVYLLSNMLGLLRTRYDLIIMHIFWNLPLGVWLMRSFLDLISPEIEEAGFVDGASNLQVLFRIVIPLIRPGIAVTAVFIFLFSFIEYLYGSILTSGDITTMPVRLAFFAWGHMVQWRIMAAAAIVSVLPMVALFALGQRHLVRGITFGAIR